MIRAMIARMIRMVVSSMGQHVPVKPHNRTDYNRGCRCEQCMDATRRATQNWRRSEQIVPCWFCSRSFKNEKGRNVHMTRVHEREGGME